MGDSTVPSIPETPLSTTLLVLFHRGQPDCVNDVERVCWSWPQSRRGRGEHFAFASPWMACAACLVPTASCLKTRTRREVSETKDQDQLTLFQCPPYHRCDPWLEDRRQGKTAQDLARERGHYDLANILRGLVRVESRLFWQHVRSNSQHVALGPVIMRDVWPDWIPCLRAALRVVYSL